MTTDDQTPEDMPYYVTGIKQTNRGLAAEVRIGTAGPPGAQLVTTVTLNPLDPKWLAIKDSLEKLYAERAIEKIDQMQRWARDHR